MHTPHQFSMLTLRSDEENAAAQFLQGQVTVDVSTITTTFVPTAICNLKGRVDFGIWLKQDNAQDYQIVIAADCADDFAAHIKKYGAFSKITLSDATPAYVSLEQGVPTFAATQQHEDVQAWLAASIATGNAIITQATRGLFQPQALRLHQRGGVHYNKGCYLGQEVVARLWFKASPKAWMHRVTATDVTQDQLSDDHIKLINWVETDTGIDALVIARPEQLADSMWQICTLPEPLDGGVSRTEGEPS